MASSIAKFYAGICKIEATLAKASIAIMTALVLVSAVARTMRQPVDWAVDFAIFLFVWSVFFCADMAMRNDKLVTVDLVTVHLPKKIQFYLKLVNYTIMMAFLAYMVHYASWLSYTSRFVRFQGIAWFSYSWVVLSVPVGCTLLFITTALKLWEHYRKGC
ncbi:MAG: TRAP transporter small permease subunit [Firmicutes bacterium]|nr:TRAP transporter small permease subunit [Dethiobacter sp.]MBS3888064.1 TRAP transporter small permease subunit [Bacillota bacterium]